MSNDQDESVKKMADLLRRGATLLATACPQCGSPLMKVDDNMYCATCDRRVVVVESEEEMESHAVKALLPQLQQTLIKKLDQLNDVIKDENDAESLTKLANLMVLLLQALHKLQSMHD